MTNTETTNTAKATIDRKRFSLRILRLLDEHSGKKDIYFYPGTYYKLPPELTRQLELADDEIAQWGKDWCWEVHSLLREEGLVEPLPNWYYRSVISDRGREFIGKPEAERESEMDKMWQKYDEAATQFNAPISTNQFIKAIRQWDKEVGTKRTSRNVKRYLAELYLEQKGWDDLVNLPNSDSSLVCPFQEFSQNWYLQRMFAISFCVKFA